MATLTRENYLRIASKAGLPGALVGHPAIKRLAEQAFSAGVASKQSPPETDSKPLSQKQLPTAPRLPVLEGEVLPPESDLHRKARELLEEIQSGRVA